MASALSEWTNKTIFVLTCDGRTIVGTLAGYDQLQNLILKSCEERVHSPDGPVDVVPLGLYVIRGDNVAVIADTREEEGKGQEGKERWREVRAEPVKSVVQNVL